MTIQTPQVTQILRVNTQKTIRMCPHKKKKNQFLENLLAVSLILIFVYFHQSLSEE